MPVNKKIVCFDFDGVIHSYTSGWKGSDKIPDPPVEGALGCLIRLLHEPLSDKYEVNIYSSRSHQPNGISAMKMWLIKWFKSLYPALNPLILVDGIKFPIYKPPAYVTIDDRVICFEGRFDSIINDIEDFKPWHKKGV